MPKLQADKTMPTVETTTPIMLSDKPNAANILPFISDTSLSTAKATTLTRTRPNPALHTYNSYHYFNDFSCLIRVKSHKLVDFFMSILYNVTQSVMVSAKSVFLPEQPASGAVNRRLMLYIFFVIMAPEFKQLANIHKNKNLVQIIN